MRFYYVVDDVNHYHRDFRIPVDEIGGNSPDGIADKWQETEAALWCLAQGMPPTTAADLIGVWAMSDLEPADPDGDGGPLPAHKTAGDGLMVLQEYRGFLLDGGGYHDQNGVWHVHEQGHTRLSAAHKEVLLEVDTAQTFMNLGKIPAADRDGKDADEFLRTILNEASKVFSAPTGQRNRVWDWGGSPWDPPANINNAGGAGIRVYWVRDQKNLANDAIRDFPDAEDFLKGSRKDPRLCEFVHVVFVI